MVDNNGSWVLKYNYYDYMGSLRYCYRDINDNSTFSYSAFGKIADEAGTHQRLNYIAKEGDAETKVMNSRYVEQFPADANHGVRQYSSELGRFMVPDQLWEKYIGWSPYQYSMNNPVNAKDRDGKYLIFPNNEVESEMYKEALIYICQSKIGKEIVDYLADSKGDGLKKNVYLTIGNVDYKGKAAYSKPDIEVDFVQDGGGISKQCTFKSGLIIIDNKKVDVINDKQDFYRKVAEEIVHMYRATQDPAEHVGQRKKSETKKEEKKTAKIVNDIINQVQEIIY